MADQVDVNELDASDLSDILTEMKGETTKVKNAVAGRKELSALLVSKKMTLTTDDEGNFVLNPIKAAKAAAPAKGKAAKPAPEPEPEEEGEEEEAEVEAEAEEEEEEEAPPPKKGAKPAAKPAPAPAKKKAKEPEPEEEEAEEEVEAEAEAEEEEEEEEAPPPPKKGAKPAAPTKKVAAKAPADDEEEEVAAPKAAKRAPPPREAIHKPETSFTIAEPDRKFKDDSIRYHLWKIMLKCKTVGGFMSRAAKHEREDVQATARGFLNVAVKDGWITINK